MEKVYLVTLNADLTEGRGPMIPKFVTRDNQTAEKISRDLDPTGVFTDIIDFKVIKDYESFKMNRFWEVRERAMSKLTPEEIKVLNL